LKNREFLHGQGIRYGSTIRNVIHKKQKLTKERAEDSDEKVVRLILRTDVDGTLEAIQNVLDTYDFAEVELQIVDAAVGAPYEELIDVAAEFKGSILACTII
jgi:translation initiation factor IF-2